jgi:hypothetical protein
MLVCPPHLTKSFEWINNNCNFHKNWHVDLDIQLDGLDDNIVTTYERYFVVTIYEKLKKNPRTALLLLCRGFLDRVPQEYRDIVLETGLVNSDDYTVYPWAFETLIFHADVWIDEAGNNKDYNGNFAEV